jgi:hypothetical protein
MKPPAEHFEMWGVLELMGHVKVAGRITEEERFGGKLGRIDIPDETEGFSTQYFGFASVYRLTAVTEEVARYIARQNTGQPIHAWDLARIKALQPAGPEMVENAIDGDYDLGDED